jgi:site-specific recombinase XerD
MPRKRLPPKCHVKDGRYYYVDKNKWNGLSRVSEGVRELHRRLASLTDAPPNTLAGIFAAYADNGMDELKPATRKQYDYFLFGILDHTFGHLTPHEIDDGTIAQYLEKRKREGAAVAGNRERACLSSVFEFAMRQGWARRNPCRGVRRNRERASKVHVESDDLAAAIDRAPVHFVPVLQLAYMTGMRQVDEIELRVSDITPAGIEYTESKTGKPVTHTWTPTLRKLIRGILETRAALDPQPAHDRLLTNRFGQPLTMWGIISNMRRLKVKWSFRAIRPKAQTDGADRNVIGHMGQMRERYTRRRKLVPVR